MDEFSGPACTLGTTQACREETGGWPSEVQKALRVWFIYFYFIFKKMFLFIYLFGCDRS